MLWMSRLLLEIKRNGGMYTFYVYMRDILLIQITIFFIFIIFHKSGEQRNNANAVMHFGRDAYTNS